MLPMKNIAKSLFRRHSAISYSFHLKKYLYCILAKNGIWPRYLRFKYFSVVSVCPKIISPWTKPTRNSLILWVSQHENNLLLYCVNEEISYYYTEVTMQIFPVHTRSQVEYFQSPGLID
jgi:hypothetical protein